MTKLAVNEYLKTDSNFLRGTILEGLNDQLTGSISEADQQLTKFHGMYQQDDRDLRAERRQKKLEKSFSFMIRVRVPGGVCTPKQWIEMDRIADQYANGQLKLTTRQAFQFHGVFKYILKKTIQEINAQLLDTLAACGDVNRNVMCTADPSESDFHRQAVEAACQISEHLSPRTRAYHEIWLDGEKVAGGEEEEPIYGKTYLPRKFKAAVVIPPSNDVDVFSQDLGFIAIAEKDQLVGFNLTVGGGFGTTHGNKATYPRLADVVGFLKTEQLLEVSEEVLKIQRDFGDRTNRKHARFKYTIDDRGLDWFKQELNQRLGYSLEPPRPYRLTHNGDRYGWHRVSNGTWSFTPFVQHGRLKDTEGNKQKTAFRKLAEIHTGDIRLTGNQGVCFGGITDKAKPEFERLLKEFDLDQPGKLSGLRRNSMACVALPTCGLAMAESERFLPDLISDLEKEMDDAGIWDDEIVIRMTGCPNGCARPFLGEIGFIGKTPGRYNVYLGAGFEGQRLNKLYKESLNHTEIIDALSPIIHHYAKEKDTGERFGDFVIRTGYVKATTAGKNFHD